jgi:hypothetical protein
MFGKEFLNFLVVKTELKKSNDPDPLFPLRLFQVYFSESGKK